MHHIVTANAETSPGLSGHRQRVYQQMCWNQCDMCVTTGWCVQWLLYLADHLSVCLYCTVKCGGSWHWLGATHILRLRRDSYP